VTALKLVSSAEIVQFPKVSTFDDAWALRKGQMRTRGDGREKTRKLWEKAAGKVGSARLLEALRRYLREEKEPTCGYPGLSVWLNGERYDHWLSAFEITGDDKSTTCRPLAPEPIRRKLMGALPESFVLAYVDPATFDGLWIIPRTDTARKKLLEVKEVLRACGIAGMRQKP
jgi:hypothetical protein